MTADAAGIVRLAACCEQATGPDRELDGMIQRAMGPYFPSHYSGAGVCNAFTASLDAAATIAPDGWDWSVSSYGEDGASAEAWEHGWQDDTRINSFLAPTAPLCLVVALLRARAASALSDGEG